MCWADVLIDGKKPYTSQKMKKLSQSTLILPIYL